MQLFEVKVGPEDSEPVYVACNGFGEAADIVAEAFVDV